MLLVVGVLAGFAIASFFSGKETGEKGRISLKVRVKDYFLHIHHWMFGSVILLGAHEYFQDHILFHPSVESFLYAFLVGLIIQGLTYSDFYKFVYPAEDRAEGEILEY